MLDSAARPPQLPRITQHRPRLPRRRLPRWRATAATLLAPCGAAAHPSTSRRRARPRRDARLERRRAARRRDARRATMDSRLAPFASARWTVEQFAEQQLGSLSEKARGGARSTSCRAHRQLTYLGLRPLQGIRTLSSELATLRQAASAEMQRSVFANYGAFIRCACAAAAGALLLALRNPRVASLQSALARAPAGTRRARRCAASHARAHARTHHRLRAQHRQGDRGPAERREPLSRAAVWHGRRSGGAA